MLLAILLFLSFLAALALLFVVAVVGGIVKTFAEMLGEMRREFFGGRR